MMTFLLVVHLLVTLAMVATILLQRSEGGGLVGSNTSFLTARGSANLLTRLTAILAAAFIILSLVLAILAGTGRKSRSILDHPSPSVTLPETAPVQPASPAASGVTPEKK